MYAAPEISLAGQVLLRDDGGTVFIDYLTAGLLRYPPNAMPVAHIGIHPDFPSYHEAVLMPHRDAIAAQMKVHRDSPRVWEKYAWLARYHNYACKRLHPDDPDLIITTNEGALSEQAEIPLQLTPTFGRRS